MMSVTVPKGIRKVADRFKDTFSCNYNCLCTLLALHFFDLKSFSNAVRFFGWSQSVSSLHNAAHKFESKTFMKRLRASVRRKLKKALQNHPDDFCYAIDDTDNIKYGKKIYASGYWRKHSGGIYHGQKIILLTLVHKSKGYAIPLHYYFVHKKEHPEYESGHQLVIRLLDEIIDEKFPKLPVVLDSWFDSVPLMQKLQDHNFSFCIQCKNNRVIKSNPSPYAYWKSWSQIFHSQIKTLVRLSRSAHQKRNPKKKYYTEKIVYLRKRRSPLKAIAMYNHKSDNDHYAIYVTNDLKMSGYFLYELSRKRWLIEELFRNLKQNFSFGRLACTGKEGADLSVCLSFALIISLQLFPQDWSQESAQSQSIGTRVKTAQAENLENSLNLIIENQSHPLIPIIKARRHWSRINKKPINIVAEKLEVA